MNLNYTSVENTRESKKPLSECECFICDSKHEIQFQKLTIIRKRNSNQLVMQLSVVSQARKDFVQITF